MIRRYEEWDREALEQIFKRQHLEYEFPNLSDPSMISKVVVEESGIVGMGALVRLTSEAYLLVDPEFGTHKEKWEALKELHEFVRRDCFAKGLDDVYCWLPPDMAKPFGRRLLRLGWGRNLWPSFNRKLHTPTADAKEQVCVTK